MRRSVSEVRVRESVRFSPFLPSSMSPLTLLKNPRTLARIDFLPPLLLLLISSLTLLLRASLSSLSSPNTAPMLTPSPMAWEARK